MCNIKYLYNIMYEVCIINYYEKRQKIGLFFKYAQVKINLTVKILI